MKKMLTGFVMMTGMAAVACSTAPTVSTVSAKVQCDANHAVSRIMGSCPANSQLPRKGMERMFAKIHAQCVCDGCNAGMDVEL